MRAPAPPYRDEGPHALWHVSEDATIGRFEPRDGLVWALDTRHLPLYWFPRDCPRATFWAGGRTTDEDVERFLGGERLRRVHVVEPHRLESLRTTPVVAYRLPEEPFAPHAETGGYWLAREAVEPLELHELGDLVERHARAGIELRTELRLLAFWDDVIGSTLEFSGMRLRNARG